MSTDRFAELNGAISTFSLPYTHKMLRRLARIEPEFADQYAAYLRGEMDNPRAFARLILHVEDLLHGPEQQPARKPRTRRS